MIQERADTPDASALDEIRTFLAAMATALRGTVVRFEDTTARITDLVAMRAGGANRDLVIALQNFDRLQQEFIALADVFMVAAAKSPASWLRIAGNGHPAEDAIAEIPIAGLKERLSRHLGVAMSDLMASPTSDEAVF